MLRIYFLQQWFNLSDPGVEEALYDSAGMRRFVGIDLWREPVPDETTVCKFRHLLEEHELGERLFERVAAAKVVNGPICDNYCRALWGIAGTSYTFSLVAILDKDS
jgi:IS5 family transposase